MATKKISLTKEQKAELERLRPIVVRRGLSPLMNGTLWRLALDIILATEGLVPHYRLKNLLDKADPPNSGWQGVLPDGLPLYNYIEWLEVKTREGRKPDLSEQLHSALREQKIPCEITQNGVRILSYKCR